MTDAMMGDTPCCRCVEAASGLGVRLICSGGSDWREIEMLSIDTATGAPTKLGDKLEYVKFSSMTWTHDHKVGVKNMLVPNIGLAHAVDSNVSGMLREDCSRASRLDSLSCSRLLPSAMRDGITRLHGILTKASLE